MPWRTASLMLLVLAALAVPAAAQQVVDRILAVVEGEPILQSDVRELGRFQQLADGRTDSDAQLLQKLIEQWIVAREAEAARFAHPSDGDVQREVQRLAAQFAAPQAYAARLRELGLQPAAVERLVGRQVFLSRYLDYKFRPAAQIQPEQAERYYREELTPQLRARGQAVPALETVREQIEELLIQREISARVSRWLNESADRLRIEIRREAGKP